ncbi:tyrosine-type recombinase/integrase [Oerskovia sp. USHLN155]|uniref:tyrosine-type recombinase/integrase n=1 Tax=Oerskovia sp. USHLN155 TaxID=3081288 RepID=UPI0030160E0B
MRDVERLGAEAARKVKRADDEPVDEALTVSQLLRHHLDTLSGITEGTRRRYELIARETDGYRISRLPLNGVSRTDVALWIRELEQTGKSGKTIQMRHQLLSAAYRTAIDDELVIRNPARGARIPRTEQRERTFLTPEEFMQLYAVIPDEWRPLIHTLAGTGLRFGEATALKVSDLSLNDRVPSLRVARTWTYIDGTARKTGAPKTASGRRAVALGAGLAAHLREHTVDRERDSWVFTRKDGVLPIVQATLYSNWRKWIAAAGLEKRPRVHDLRHSHVAWMLAAGRPLDQIRNRLGHSSIKVTVDTYGHLMPGADEEMAAAAGRAIPDAFVPRKPI